MEISRNQWFVIGFIVLFIGIQFRLIHSYTLTPEATKVLAKQMKHPVAATDDAMAGLLGGGGTAIPGKVLVPPEWIGFSLISVGAVIFLLCITQKNQ